MRFIRFARFVCVKNNSLNRPDGISFVTITAKGGLDELIGHLACKNERLKRIQKYNTGKNWGLTVAAKSYLSGKTLLTDWRATIFVQC
jgi:hypothetical protein